MIVIVVTLAAVLAVAFLARSLLRRQALRIEDRDAPTDEKVHSLQRLALWLPAVMLIAYGAVFGALGAEIGRHRHSVAIAVTAAVAMLVVVTAVPFLLRKTVRPSLARVRDVPIKPPRQTRQVVVSTAVMIVVGVIIGGGLALAPKSGVGRPATIIAVYLVAVVVVQSLVAPLLVASMRTHDLPPDTHRRLSGLAERMGVNLRDIRRFEGRQQKVANAVQVGTIPRLRYVLVSDYLLDKLPDDQVDAVAAHEFGHIRGKHVLVRLCAVAAVLAVIETALLLSRGADAKGAAALLFIPFIVAFPLGTVLVNGLLGVRLERSADDYAARAVGAGQLASALEKIAELNHTKRNTGRGWSLLTQHPGVNDRVTRLRALRAGPQAPSAADDLSPAR